MIAWLLLCQCPVCPQWQELATSPPLIRIELCLVSEPLVNQPLEIRVRVIKSADPIDRLVVDGRMPAHRHGLTHRVRVERVAEQEWRVSDLVLHMPGHWLISFDVDSHGNAWRIELPLELRRAP